MKDDKNNYYNQEQEERAKKMIMLTGIIFFMVLIIFIWAVNTKKVFKNVSATQTQEDPELEEAKEDLNEIFDNLKTGISQLKSEEDAESQTEGEKQENKTLDVKDDELKILKEKLESPDY